MRVSLGQAIAQPLTGRRMPALTSGIVHYQLIAPLHSMGLMAVQQRIIYGMAPKRSLFARQTPMMAIALRSVAQFLRPRLLQLVVGVNGSGVARWAGSKLKAVVYER